MIKDYLKNLWGLVLFIFAMIGVIAVAISITGTLRIVVTLLFLDGAITWNWLNISALVLFLPSLAFLITIKNKNF